jgi:hypothetical protein
MPFTEAIQHVQSRRCCIHISEALHNQLREFETIYQNRGVSFAVSVRLCVCVCVCVYMGGRAFAVLICRHDPTGICTPLLTPLLTPLVLFAGQCIGLLYCIVICIRGLYCFVLYCDTSCLGFSVVKCIVL